MKRQIRQKKSSDKGFDFRTRFASLIRLNNLCCRCCRSGRKNSPHYPYASTAHTITTILTFGKKRAKRNTWQSMLNESVSSNVHSSQNIVGNKLKAFISPAAHTSSATPQTLALNFHTCWTEKQGGTVDAGWFASVFIAFFLWWVSQIRKHMLVAKMTNRNMLCCWCGRVN